MPVIFCGASVERANPQLLAIWGNVTRTERCAFAASAASFFRSNAANRQPAKEDRPALVAVFTSSSKPCDRYRHRDRMRDAR
jgi:hypothetical protein